MRNRGIGKIWFREENIDTLVKDDRFEINVREER